MSLMHSPPHCATKALLISGQISSGYVVADVKTTSDVTSCFDICSDVKKAFDGTDTALYSLNFKF